MVSPSITVISPGLIASALGTTRLSGAPVTIFGSGGGLGCADKNTPRSIATQPTATAKTIATIAKASVEGAIFSIIALPEAHLDDFVLAAVGAFESAQLVTRFVGWLDVLTARH
jgi:hypothetical protein